jgi:hypothetical protein
MIAVFSQQTEAVLFKIFDEVTAFELTLYTSTGICSNKTPPTGISFFCCLFVFRQAEDVEDDIVEDLAVGQGLGLCSQIRERSDADGSKQQ